MASVVRDAINGGLGGMAATALAYPLVIAKVKLQAQFRHAIRGDGEDDEEERRRRGSTEEVYTGTLDVLRKVLRHEGVLGWYRGLPPALVKNFLTNFVYYLAHSSLKPLYKVGDAYRSWLTAFLHGVSAGFVVQLIMLPMEMVVTRLQAQRLGHSATFLEAAAQIVKEGGVLHFWSGLPPALTLTLNPGVTTTVQSALTGGRRLSPVVNFWVGFLSKLIASTTTYPVVLVKVRMLVRSHRHHHHHHHHGHGHRGHRRGHDRHGCGGGDLESDTAQPPSAHHHHKRPGNHHRRRGDGSGGEDGRAESARAADAGSCAASPDSGANGVGGGEFSGKKGCAAGGGASKGMVKEALALALAILQNEGVGGFYVGLQAQLWQAVAKEAILNTVRRGLGST